VTASTEAAIDARADPAAARVKAAEAADVVRIPRWLGAKALYAAAPVSWLFRLATWRGSVDARFSRAAAHVRETVERHLEPEAPEEARKVTQQFFQFRWRAGFTRLWPQVRGFVGADGIEVVGLEHLDAALARGNGAVLVTTHFGYPRLIKPILRRHGYEVLLSGKLASPSEQRKHPPGFTLLGVAVHRKLLRLPIWWRFDERWQQAVGADLPAALNVRPHLAALAQNRAVVLVADGGSAGSPAVTIFGIDVTLSTAPFSIARAGGALALPVFVVDTLETAGPRALRLQIHPPLSLDAADRSVNVRRFASVYEEQARRYPHNWQWGWIRNGQFRVRREDR
jgi:lauroyl/myristoyl acyltransferase